MPRVSRASAVAALVLIAGCADRPDPVAPGDPPLPTTAIARPVDGVSARARHERLARLVALAMRDEGFRAEIHDALRRSPLREGKVHLQAVLGANGGRARAELARLGGVTEAALQTDLTTAAPIELYLPVAAHRAAWTGDTNVLVATAETDRDRPVAFDTRGLRQQLSATAPPVTPVIALGRAETQFQQTLLCDGCFVEDPPDGGGSGGGGGAGGSGASLVSPGLYMTSARFTETFEGWLKGDPEFEVHVLGQEGTSTALKSYQCAGQHAGGPYAFDQNQTTWSGRVLLFSQAQFDAYRAQHPGQAYRVFVVEDDDAACQIKADSARFERLISDVEAGIGPLSGGIDSTLSIGKAYKAARAGWKVLKSFWSWITTQDDLVGNAVEDVVAGEYQAGANWIIKTTGGITKGAIKLELITP
jgi:hypothetical protein